MTSTTKAGRTFRTILLIGVLVLICVAVGLAVLHRAPWVIPAAEKEKKNPLTPTEANLSAAKKIYNDKCTDCHGEKGKGDGPDAMMYDPSPSDLTNTAKINARTDGEIYFQITEGRKPMPAFKKKLTEEQRWQLVLYVRALAAHTAPPAETVEKPNAAESQGKPN